MTRSTIGLIVVLLASLFGQGGSGAQAGFVWHTLLVVWLGLSIFFGGPSGRRLDPAFSWMAAGMSLMAVSVLIWGPNRYGGWLTAVECLSFFTVAALCARIGMAAIPRILPLLLVAASAESIWMLFQAFTRDDVVRPAGTLFNPNHAGAWLMIVVLLQTERVVASLIAKDGSFLRKIMWIMLPLIGLLSTQSRGALLGLIVGVCVLLALNFAHLTQRLRRMLVIGAVLVTLAVMGIVGQRFTEDDPFRFHRIRIWSAVSALIADHPWTGVGAGQFAEAAATVRFPDGVGLFHYDRKFSGTHSDWLRLPAEMGLPMLLLVGIAGFKTLRRTLEIRRKGDLPSYADGALAAVAAWLVQSGVDNLSERPAVFLLLAALCGMLASRAIGESEPRRTASRIHRAVAITLLLGVWAVGEWAPWRSWAVRDPSRVQLESARSLNRLDAEVWMRLAELEMAGETSLDIERYAASREAFERSIFLDSAAADRYRRAARLEARACLNLFRDVASRERVSRLYDEAADRSPYDTGIRLEHGLFLLDAGDPAGARRQAEAARRLEPAAALAQLILAQAALAEGHLVEARAALDDAQRQSEEALLSFQRSTEEARYGVALSRLPQDRVAMLHEALQ